MPVIDATVGGATANSFGTLTEANTYFDERPHSEVWVDGDEDLNAAALIQATRIMSAAKPWTGTTADEDQALPWPRLGMVSLTGFPIPETIIPLNLKYATFELAIWLLQQDRLGSEDPLVTGIRRIKAGPMEIEYQSIKFDEIQSAREFVLPDIVNLLLVPSWYQTVRVISVFEAIG